MNIKLKNALIAPLSKEKTDHLRCDSILTVRELVELLAQGDKVLEKQMRDTLSDLPLNDYRTMNRNREICRIVLSTGLCFLESEGYKLPGWASSFKEKKGSEKSTSLPIVKTSTNMPTQHPEHIRYLADEIKKWDSDVRGNVSAKKLKAYVISQIDAGEKGIPFQKYGAAELKKRGEDKVISAFQNMYTSAKKLSDLP